MDRELAKHVLTVCFHSLALLQDLLPVLKKHCSESEYSELMKGISSVSGHMSMDLLNTIFTKFPDLENEVEEKIQKYGKFI